MSTLLVTNRLHAWIFYKLLNETEEMNFIENKAKTKQEYISSQIKFYIIHVKLFCRLPSAQGNKNKIHLDRFHLSPSEIHIIASNI